MKSFCFLIFGVMCLSLQVSANTEDDINAIYDDAEKEVQDMFEKFWGGICISDDQCLEAVAFCDKSAGKSASVLGNLAVDGQCRPNIWIWIALAAVVLLLLGSCICCICCGLCSCLYKWAYKTFGKFFQQCENIRLKGCKQICILLFSITYVSGIQIASAPFIYSNLITFSVNPKFIITFLTLLSFFLRLSLQFRNSLTKRNFILRVFSPYEKAYI